MIEELACPDKPTVPFAERTQGDINQSDRGLAFLEKLLHRSMFPRSCEIGVYGAVTTTMLSRLGPVVAVDWFQGDQHEGANEEAWKAVRLAEQARRTSLFLSTITRWGRENITVLTGSSHDVLPILKNDRFGLVLVDASHAYDDVLQDLRDTWDLVTPGGYLALDDFSQIIIGGKIVDDVKRAWEAFVQEKFGGKEPPGFTPKGEGSPPKLVAFLKE